MSHDHIQGKGGGKSKPSGREVVRKEEQGGQCGCHGVSAGEVVGGNIIEGNGKGMTAL